MLFAILFIAAPEHVTVPASAGGSAPATVLDVPADIASDCSADVTASLVRFLASVPDHSTIAFASNGCYRVEGTLEVVGRTGLVIDGRNATFRATATGDGQRSHWRFVGGSDLTIQDLRIFGPRRESGTDAGFVPELQHQMGIDLLGVRGMRIFDVTVGDVHGDCLYVGADEDTGAWTRDVEVRGMVCSDAGRSGVSVTAGRGVEIADGVIARPELWGVDIEPNGGTTGAVEVRISANVFTPGALPRPFVQAVGSSGGGRVDGIAVYGNVVRGGTLQARFVPAPGQRWSDVTFVGNTSDRAWLASSADGASGGAVVVAEDIDGITVEDNHQPGADGRGIFLYAARTCGVRSGGNDFPEGGRLTVIVPYACGGL
jgi:hypothetical protein